MRAKKCVAVTSGSGTMGSVLGVLCLCWLISTDLVNKYLPSQDRGRFRDRTAGRDHVLHLAP